MPERFFIQYLYLKNVNTDTKTVIVLFTQVFYSEWARRLKANKLFSYECVSLARILQKHYDLKSFIIVITDKLSA